jgi:hypothetical protein
MGRDERVEHDGYADQDPRDVARQLTDAVDLVAMVLSRLGPEEWEHSVMYNYPRRSERSLRSMAVHRLHEVRHHLLDVRRQLASAVLCTRVRPAALLTGSGLPSTRSDGSHSSRVERTSPHVDGGSWRA